MFWKRLYQNIDSIRLLFDKRLNKIIDKKTYYQTLPSIFQLKTSRHQVYRVMQSSYRKVGLPWKCEKWWLVALLIEFDYYYLSLRNGHTHAILYTYLVVVVIALLSLLSVICCYCCWANQPFMQHIMHHYNIKLIVKVSVFGLFSVNVNLLNLRQIEIE